MDFPFCTPFMETPRCLLTGCQGASENASHQAAVESLPREHAQIEAFTPTKKWSVVPQGLGGGFWGGELGGETWRNQDVPIVGPILGNERYLKSTGKYPRKIVIQ